MRRTYVTMTIRIDGTEKEFIVDTGSPVTTIPPDKGIIKGRKIIPVTKKYQDVNWYEVLITGKNTVEGESKGIRKNMSKLITEREDFKPLFGMDWLWEFCWTTQHTEKSTTPIDQSERDKINTQIEKPFKTNQTNENTKIKTQLKPVHIPKKTKG